ncbi:uncharacterized protein BX663DRAFT_510996 [Cokeromyces recurvatus]|uniref:uncharacterized protein n=1 Tax=Cokeromyces recurvatus TaxID=90255 RepID=UPI002220179B|nr:uncharacterized protein BX663DRAFT_510996 [Cokeromyces recurvatus]KAI7902418.1 hypothetical protein BX663DRAFT_510996 [Cokeromyces recurvatus]
MNVNTIHPLSISNNDYSQSYYFYKYLNTTSKQNKALLQRQQQAIIPSIPRQHFKLLRDSSLSPIRSQKIMPKIKSKENKPIQLSNNSNSNRYLSINQSYYPVMTTLSFPTILDTRKSQQRKVSFNEKVTVKFIIFTNVSTAVKAKNRQHSPGGATSPKSILVNKISTTPLTEKITLSLKQFKNKLAFV